MSLKAAIFEFSSYTVEPSKRKISFHYKTYFRGQRPLEFTEVIVLPKTFKTIPKKLLESLHLILGASYYKFYCAPKVQIPYQLSKKQAEFWDRVYRKGLGEFFYRNKLDPRKSPKFPFSKNVKAISYKLTAKTSRYLVGIGGGKDSIVAAELLKSGKIDFDTFVVATNKKTELVEQVVQAIGAKNLTIQRKLDEKVFEKHLYNGHIPISAVYAFLGLTLATLYGHSYVVVGNEYSSNFGNITYKGEEINHQWSKSFEFEQLFQNYVKEFLTPDVRYFSLLRNLYEIRVVKLFAKHKKYFKLFSSCNRNFSSSQGTALRQAQGKWCGQCPKCVFVWTLLSAFVPKRELVSIFKKNLYQDKTLLPLFKDVMGWGMMKPFDCVGTFEEVQTALYLAKRNFGSDFIVKQLGKKAKLHPEVLRTQEPSAIPEDLKLLSAESVLIARYGMEGKVVEKYLKQKYPTIKVGLGSEEFDKDYLKKQHWFDVVIKTPGVNKKLITIPYTTPTNLFFSHFKGKNTIIGVTGSKGKSTTTSLIHHILRAGGKNAVLLGNIGKPMLEYVMRPVSKETIFVLELSSFQLDDLQFSPDVSVVTNLFPEHMDYHGGLEQYYAAKKNIINFQNEDNYLFYNLNNTELKRWLKDYKGKAVGFGRQKLQSQLLGEHNEYNIGAAVVVAKKFGISDTVIKKAVASFKGLPHRLEKVGEYRGITFYDDAISTTPDSTIMAIKSLKNIGTIFLGGEDRGYSFTQLEKVLKQYKIKNLVLFPDSGEKILKTLRHGSGQNLRILRTKSMQEAVQWAYEHTPKGSVCLLSCASPSYSLWENFEEKGDQFKYWVRRMSN